MRKKAKASLPNKENNLLQVIGSDTLPLDFTDDTDIIECSVLENGNKFDIKTGKHSLKHLNSGDAQSKAFINFDVGIENSSGDFLRLGLRKTDGIAENAALKKDSEFSFNTPPPNKNFIESNSMMKKIISSLKKTPDGPHLSKSKLRNIEEWLRENDVEIVRTPPFANLSVTPVNSSRKKFATRKTGREMEKEKKEDHSIDSEVEDILKAVYGNDWLHKNVVGRCRTEPKKSKMFSPVVRTERKNGTFGSARRKILNVKQLNLLDNSEEEIVDLDCSVVSGVRAISLEGSESSFDQIKTKPIRNRINRKGEEASSRTPPCSSPAQKATREVSSSKRTRTPKTSNGKKLEVGFKTPKKTFLASLSVSTPTSRCHPDARDYKVNFKSKKDELVKKLYKLYNNEVFEGKLAEDMNFSWNVKLRGTAGYCYNKRLTKSSGDVIRLSRIEFSTKIVDRADRLRDTMIHELCHAASWVIDGVLDGHGAFWTRWASKATARFPELPPIKRCHNYEIVSKYVYRCTCCGYSIKRHSKSINTEKKRCGHCYGTLELLVNKKKRGKTEIPEFDTTRTLRTPNKFALFVKENYHSVKTTKANAKHADIMKTLSEQYALTKSKT